MLYRHRQKQISWENLDRKKSGCSSVMTTVVSWVSEGCSVAFYVHCAVQNPRLSPSVLQQRTFAPALSQPGCMLSPAVLSIPARSACIAASDKPPVSPSNDRFTKFTSLSRELGVSDGGFPSQDYVLGNWLVDVPPCSYPTAAVLCWFSRTRTDPLCSSGTPGLMLHRTLELVSAQI